MSKKIEIDHFAIAKIKDAAIRTFHSEHYLPEDSKDAQVYLILKGFACFLQSQGIEPNFTVKPVREDHGDPTPLDDL